MKTLFRALALTLITIVTQSFCAAAQKVANYYNGKPGTATYQSYSFWVQDGKPSAITFTYGTNRKEIKVAYLGEGTGTGKPSFKMIFPNKQLFYVIPLGNALQIVNTSLKKTELFKWEYEGPVNGVGTFCDVCTQDEKESMKLIKAYYLR